MEEGKCRVDVLYYDKAPVLLADTRQWIVLNCYRQWTYNNRLLHSAGSSEKFLLRIVAAGGRWLPPVNDVVSTICTGPIQCLTTSYNVFHCESQAFVEL